MRWTRPFFTTYKGNNTSSEGSWTPLAPAPTTKPARMVLDLGYIKDIYCVTQIRRPAPQNSWEVRESSPVDQSAAHPLKSSPTLSPTNTECSSTSGYSTIPKEVVTPLTLLSLHLTSGLLACLATRGPAFSAQPTTSNVPATPPQRATTNCQGFHWDEQPPSGMSRCEHLPKQELFVKREES